MTVELPQKAIITTQAIALPLVEVKSQEKTQPLITEIKNPKTEKKNYK